MDWWFKPVRRTHNARERRRPTQYVVVKVTDTGLQRLTFGRKSILPVYYKQDVDYFTSEEACILRATELNDKKFIVERIEVLE